MLTAVGMTSLSEVEVRLADNPADDGAWKLYAVELSARGDERATWIDAAEEDARSQAMRDAASWLQLPGFDPGEADPGFYFEWRHGFVIGLVVDLRPEVLRWPPLAERFRAFIDSPAARLLRRVEIRRVENNTDEEYIRHLAAAPRPALRELALDAYDASAIGGDALISLERLTLRGTHSLAPMSLPGLVELTVQSDRLTSKAMKSLAESELPRLATLRLSIGAADDVKPKHRPRAADLAALLAALPGLTELAIHDSPLGDEMLQQIAASPAAARLESLDLSRLALTGFGARALARANLPRLRSLVVDAGAPGREAFGAYADKLGIRRPSPAEVARHLLALGALCVVSTCRGGGAEGHQRATRLSRWAGLWLFDELADVGDAWSPAALGVLAWALGLSEDAREVGAAVMDRLPLEESVAGFVDSASLRERDELAALAQQLEDRARLAWQRFEDVHPLREALRAVRWLLGAASSWQNVPTWAVLHELPPAEAIPGAVFKRVERVWSGLRKRYREPPPGPVSEARLDAVEREIGRRFPQDLRASYLLHGAGTYPPVELLSLDGAIAWWREMDRWTAWDQEPLPRASVDATLHAMKAGSWRRSWFPITSSAQDSNFYVTDLEPTEAGRVGQIFYWGHEYPGPESVEQESFATWLEWATTAERFEPMDDEY